MSYNPDFSRDPKGKFNLDNNFVSIKNGSEDYLLEDELNEMQWIQNEQRAQAMRSMFNSGIPYDTLAVSDQNTDIDETIYIKGYGNTDLSNNAILFNIKNYIPININGYFIKLAGTYKKDIRGVATNNNNILVTLPAASATSRYDLVYLEAWFEEIDYDVNKVIKSNGGASNNSIGNFSLDSRLAVETSKRVQLKWNISVAKNAQDLKTGSVQPLNNSLNSTYVQANTIAGKSYSKDANLFVSINNIGVVDGTYYAIPILCLNRLAGTTTVSIGNVVKPSEPSSVTSHTHDDRYYRKDEIDKMFNGFGFISGTTLPAIADRKPNSLYFQIK
jgi:hypothetical protein